MIKNLFTRRNLFIVLAVVAILLAGFRVYSVSAKTPKYETVDVKKTTITQRVSAAGEIKSENEVELKFPVSGKLTYLAVKKNDRVKKWDYIGSLDKQELQRKMVKSLRDYSKERNDFEQDKQLTYKDQIFTNTVKRILEKNQWDLDKAVIDVEIADWTSKNADLYSPIDGVITKIHTQAGTSVIAGTTPIVTIADPDNISFLAKVGEADIAQVAMGQEVTVTLDAFENKKFAGRVKEIDYAATANNGGSKVYLVKIILADTAGIKLDMSGDVEILTLSHPGVLVIPRITIQEKNGNKYVEVMGEKEVKKKEITTGIKGQGGVIEILSGVSEGEKVIIQTPK